MKLTEQGKQTLNKNRGTFLDSLIFGKNDGLEVLSYIFFIVMPLVVGIMVICLSDFIALIPLAILLILFGIVMLIVTIGANINYYVEPTTKKPVTKEPTQAQIQENNLLSSELVMGPYIVIGGRFAGALEKPGKLKAGYKYNNTTGKLTLECETLEHVFEVFMPPTNNKYINPTQSIVNSKNKFLYIVGKDYEQANKKFLTLYYYWLSKKKQEKEEAERLAELERQKEITININNFW